MSTKPDRLTERRLWSECLGHCMNPSCEKDLYAETTILGELAHIVPDSEGGPPTFENMLALCRDCHKITDHPRLPETEDTLRAWKANRAREIRARFSRTYGTFEELAAEVAPLLRRNLNLYRDYGPESHHTDVGAAHALWRKFEGSVVANNSKLTALLDKNRRLLHRENQQIVDHFIGHAAEFVKTRDDKPSLRVLLFPRQLNSVFGVEATTDDLAPNVSALQNLVASLASDDRFVDLQLLPTPKILYRTTSGIREELDLRNRPRVHQVYWNGSHYRNKTTDLRLDGLLFVLKWLRRRGIHYEFRTPTNLTEITLGKRYEVYFIYKYCASLLDMQLGPLRTDLVVVNLHNWNDGPFSPSARKHASEMGSRTMNQKEFFVFCNGLLA